MLYPSQAQALQSLEEAFANGSQIAVLQGLSGTGKSLIAKEAAGEGGVVEELRRADRRVADIKGAIEKQLRVILLAQTGDEVSNYYPDAEAPAVIPVKALPLPEVNQWMDSVKPHLEENEKELVKKYSLGIPLLIERMCAVRPVTFASAMPQCSVYVQNIIETRCLGGKNRNQKLTALVSRYADFPIPDDVMSQLCDCRMVRSGKPTPLAVLHSQLSWGKPLPTPQCAELFDIYRQWIDARKDEPTFDIFVPELDDIEAKIDEIGYTRYPERPKPLLKNFSLADSRKGVTFFARDGREFSCQMDNLGGNFDSYLYPVLLQLARASGNAATVEMTEKFNRPVVTPSVERKDKVLYLHKHDHEHESVMPVAYTVECYFQKLGVAYTVQYDGTMYRYDPKKNCYEPVEYEPIDYSRELFGDQME